MHRFVAFVSVCAVLLAACSTAPAPTGSSAAPAATAAGAAPSPAANAAPSAAASSQAATSSGGAASGTLEKLSLGYNLNGGQLPEYVAMQKGFFKEQGIDMHLQQFAQNPQEIAAISNGSLDIMASIPSYVLSARESGYDLVAILQAERSRPQPPESGALMVRNDSNIKTTKDLEGKKIGVLSASSQNTIDALWAMKKEGVDVSKITLVNAPFATHFDLLKSGQVDAVATVDPFQTEIQSSGVGRVLQWSYYVSDPGQPLSAMWASRKWVEAHPDLVTKFQNAMVKAIDYLNSNPSDARTMMGQFTKLQPDVLSQMKVLNNWNYHVSKSAWVKAAQIDVDMGALKKAEDPSAYFAPQLQRFVEP